MNRINWDDYALGLAYAARVRSEDPWRQVGAAALRHDNSTAATGYNGTIPGVTVDWSDRPARQIYAIHAERNCLNYVKPGECRLIACIYLPCPECLKEIALKRIPRVVYAEEYEFNGLTSKTNDTTELAKIFKIELVRSSFLESNKKSS
jgi:dCMP deaminase